jgi:Calcineurin-like phosphoesterase
VRRPLRVLAAGGLLLCLAPASARGAPTIAAAGDIVCPRSHPAFNGGHGTRNKCRQAATAKLLLGGGYSAVLPLGDLIDPGPTLRNFRGVYRRTWGRFKRKTHPTLGNHEYAVPGAGGYFDYFNGRGDRHGRAGRRGAGWYSYEVGHWHLVALNSNCGEVGCGPRSSQVHWLKRDLRRHAKRRCVLAYWHHPRFSSGFHGNDEPTGTFWRVLFRARADVILNAHDHLYERFAPQTPSGLRNVGRGIVQFTVGTGGRSLFPIGAARSNSEVQIAGRFGILRMQLGREDFSWRFLSTPGDETLDQGRQHCTPR